MPLNSTLSGAHNNDGHRSDDCDGGTLSRKLYSLARNRAEKKRKARGRNYPTTVTASARVPSRVFLFIDARLSGNARLFYHFCSSAFDSFPAFRRSRAGIMPHGIIPRGTSETTEKHALLAPWFPHTTAATSTTSKNRKSIAHVLKSNQSRVTHAARPRNTLAPRASTDFARLGETAYTDSTLSARAKQTALSKGRRGTNYEPVYSPSSWLTRLTRLKTSGKTRESLMRTYRRPVLSIRLRKSSGNSR